MVGVWKAETREKAIEINGNGELVSFTNAAGMKILVSEGGISQKGRDEKAMLYLILGETPVEYDEETTTLKVTINFDDYHIEVAGGSVSGKMKETLEGRIDFKTMSWLAQSTVEGTLENLPQANDSNSEYFVFKKIKKSP